MIGEPSAAMERCFVMKIHSLPEPHVLAAALALEIPDVESKDPGLSELSATTILSM